MTGSEDIAEAPLGTASESESRLPTERTVEFGWADNRPITGRRATKEKEKKKIKAGSFGKSKCR